MPMFEVYFPPAQEGGEAQAFHVESGDWLEALKSGLDAVGEEGDVMSSLMCDVKEDNTIHATDSRTGRVFLVRELAGDELTQAQADYQAYAGSSDTPQAEAEAPKVRKTEETGTRDVQIGRVVTPVNIEEVLADVWDRAQGCYDKGSDHEAGVGFMLDLLMEKVPSESGAVFIADANEMDLFFGAARGPKADEVMDFRVPMGKGIVGFSAQEGIGVAVSDASRDPRFYKEISTSLNYETRSLLCVPMEHDGALVGAMELINRHDGDSFTTEEMSVAEYLARQTAEYLLNTAQDDDEEEEEKKK